MTNRLRIPGLIDLVRTDDPATIARLVPDPRLDRGFSGSGPLVNRIVFRRIRRVLWSAGGPVAGVAPRGDLERARRQDELAHKLAAELDRGKVAPEAVGKLAIWLRGDGGAPPPGPTVQAAVGQIFRQNFAGTAETWRAACIVDAAPRSFNPFRRLGWLLSGEPEKSRRLLSQSVDGDPAAMHGIAVAVHSLLRSLEAMRDLWRNPGCRSLSPEAAAFRALRAPPSVVRRWSARATTPEGDVRPGTMVVFDLAAAHRRQPGDRFAFMAGDWSECPARHWVTALLQSVWQQAKGSLPAEMVKEAGPTAGA